MKTLYIARHAKSSWRNTSLIDIDRPLKSSGVMMAYKVAKRLIEAEVNLDAIYSSPAIRAMHTAIIYARTLEFPENRVEIRPSLYNKGKEGIYELVKQVNEDYNSIMITGHDPTLTHFVNEYMAVPLEKLQTSGIIQLDLETDKWTHIRQANPIRIVYFKREETRELKYAKQNY
ncbi:histidine phosphatase family protein [bacterium SCSIO 12741]|nr:histidine phosphatase family protein [bacterium SCSIO 12741]